MSGQNRYRMSHEYKDEGWIDRDDVGVWTGDTWQDAIHNFVDAMNSVYPESFQSVSETPAEDGKSGIMEIKTDPLPEGGNVLKKVKATLIED